MDLNTGSIDSKPNKQDSKKREFNQVIGRSVPRRPQRILALLVHGAKCFNKEYNSTILKL